MALTVGMKTLYIRHARDEPSTKAFTKALTTTSPSTVMASSSSSGFVSYAADPNYTKMEGFRVFQSCYNTRNTQVTKDDPNTLYPSATTTYNQLKNSSLTKREFEELSFKDFIGAGHVASHQKLKCLSLTPYYHVQMGWCMRRWDKHDNKGTGDEVVNTCQQLIGIVSVRLCNLMADVQEMVGLVYW